MYDIGAVCLGANGCLYCLCTVTKYTYDKYMVSAGMILE